MLSLQVTAFLAAAVLLPTGVVLLVLGFRPPRAAAGPRTDGPVPHLIRRLVPGDHRSTYSERQECRLRLGPSFETQLVSVADNLARRPAALRGIVMESDDVPIDDLVTVSTYLHGAPTGLDRALRNGTAEAHRPVLACLISGLRRFPQYQGPCFSVARAVGIPLDAYVPGRTIVEPAFIRTDTRWTSAAPNGYAPNADRPSGDRPSGPDDTEIRFAFWSRTARQVSALGTGSNTVLFSSGTSFRVLLVTPAQDGPGVVFLSENPKPAGFRGLQFGGLAHRNVLRQLRRAVSPGEPGPATAAVMPDLGFTPGFDETGRPYREEAR